MKTCRACKAPVLFVKTPIGRTQILDAEPIHDGAWVIVDEVVHRYEGIDEGPRYRAHWASCPASDLFKQPRGKK